MKRGINISDIAELEQNARGLLPDRPTGALFLHGLAIAATFILSLLSIILFL